MQGPGPPCRCAGSSSGRSDGHEPCNRPLAAPAPRRRWGLARPVGAWLGPLAVVALADEQRSAWRVEQLGGACASSPARRCHAGERSGATSPSPHAPTAEHGLPAEPLGAVSPRDQEPLQFLCWQRDREPVTLAKHAARPGQDLLLRRGFGTPIKRPRISSLPRPNGATTMSTQYLSSALCAG